MLQLDYISTTANLVRLAIITIVLCSWLSWLWRRKHIYAFALRFPGHWGLPYLGSFCITGTFADFLHSIDKYIKKTRLTTFVFWAGIRPVLYTTDPKVIEQVLNSPDCLQKGAFYSIIEQIVGPGILTSKVDKWMHNRKRINPCFSHKVLLSLFPIFNKAKKSAIAKLRQLDDGQEHELTELISNFTVSIPYETTMGKEIKYGEATDENFVHYMKSTVRALSHQADLFFVGLQKLIFLIKPNFFSNYQGARKIIRKLINERMQKCNENESNLLDERQESLYDIKKQPRIFIDQTIELYRRGEISFDDIVAESNTIFFAAFDTTSNAVHSALILLAMQPEIQKRLYEEISQILREKTDDLQYEDIDELPYLDLFLNEVLRLVSPVPIISREPTKDLELVIDDKKVIIPKGIQITVGLFHLHRRTDIWGENADEFDIDHVSPESLKEKHSCSFLPFSKGIRNCIGWRYSQYNLRVILCGLINNFEFSTTAKLEDLQFHNNVTITFRNPPKFKVRIR